VTAGRTPSPTAAGAGIRLRRAVVIAALVAALVPASAAAAQKRAMCADRAVLYDAPGRIAIGHLYRPQRLSALATTTDSRWTYVRTPWGVTGWIRTRALCRPQ
jgi:hypothetical protein